MKYLKTYEEVTITFNDDDFINIVRYACENNNLKLIPKLIEGVNLNQYHLNLIIPKLIDDNNFKLLNYIIDNNVSSVNELVPYLYNIFYISIKKRRYELIKLFIDKGLNIKDKDYLKKELLQSFPFIDIVKILVDNGEIVSNEHIYQIFEHYKNTKATNQALEIIKYLLENFDMSNIKDFETKINYNTVKTVNVYDVIEEIEKTINIQINIQKYNKLINMLETNFPDFYNEINIRKSSKKYNL